ncbi:hypothetical protein GCM10009665_33010 [Kitasatospora nipponensis]|uniref:Uncharacterized protein n=1 Tax=Kitasatospora nipponensis TaxID=258049 RepID=A0ABP4GWD4_9ACTN
MPNISFESPDERFVREQRAAAMRTVTAMVDALALAGLPPLVSLAAARVTWTPHGVHIELGGCGVRTLQAIADHISEHAHCTGRVIPGHTLPSGLAELPGVRKELST